jgi:hypothetical protein
VQRCDNNVTNRVVIIATEILLLSVFIRTSYHILRLSFQFWLFVYTYLTAGWEFVDVSCWTAYRIIIKLHTFFATCLMFFVCVTYKYTEESEQHLRLMFPCILDNGFYSPTSVLFVVLCSLFLLLFVVLVTVHCSSYYSFATLTEVFPCFCLSCKANARV